MKGKIVIYVGLLLGLVACSDTAAVRSVEGAYRFKTTGQVTIEENYTGATKADTMLITLANETGTLEMVSLHKGDSMLLTIDPLNGQLAVTHGLVNNGSRFDFVPFSRNRFILGPDRSPGAFPECLRDQHSKASGCQ